MERENSQSNRVSTSGSASASRASTGKRSSTNIRKAPATFDPDVTVANHAVLTGIHPISVGAQTVVHPHARIISTYSAVDIGQGCVISEKAVVGLSDLSQDSDQEGLKLPETIRIGNNVSIETGAVVEAAEVGENTLIDVDAKVGAGATVGKVIIPTLSTAVSGSETHFYQNCTIGASSVVPPAQNVPDYTVIYGNNQRRMNRSLQTTQVMREIKAKGHEKQLNILQRLVPSNLAKWQ